MASEPIRVLMAASEVVGFAKTGGLADVAGSLPSALNRRGLSCGVILPLYNSARKAHPKPEPTDIVLPVPVGYKHVEARLWRSSLPDGVPVWLVQADQYFARDDPSRGMGPYQHAAHDGTRYDYADNCERFAFFNRAVVEAIPRLGAWPDVVHVNDWQTGLIPAYISEVCRARDERFWRTRTVMTIHNIAFQGTFPAWDMPLTCLPGHLYNHNQLEYHNRLSFLKAGIVFCDRITTVSPTYAEEIQTPQFGRGMEGLLRANRHRLVGIVNGADYSLWSPEKDRHLPANYSGHDLSGKAACKRALQSEMGLEEDATRPLFAVVARLTEQKGVGLIVQVAPGLLDRGYQLVVLGEGDRQYHEQLEGLRKRYHRRMGLLLGFDEALAHRIEAGADIFLMPSSFEPSGLNQLYSLRYGTPPVVRATGGLADTVTDTTPQTLAAGTATGFSFGPYKAHDLWLTIERAAGLYRDYSDLFREVMLNGMRQDWSWDRSAAEYELMYREMLGRQA